MFKEIDAVVRKDISRFNRLSEYDRGGRQYKCTSQSDSCTIVTNSFDDQADKMTLNLIGDEYIEVLRNNSVVFLVRIYLEPLDDLV